MDITNPFTIAQSAQRYSDYRPQLHQQIIDHARTRWPAETPCGRGLDIGCGTGLSSAALAQFAPFVVALDVSAEMLSAAIPHPGVRFMRAPAEVLPFRDQQFDLATIGCALHWCVREDVLVEVHRVLKPGGRLVVYDNGLMGPTEPFPEFERWHRNDLLTQYPAPTRHPTFRADMAWKHRFRVDYGEYLEMLVPYNPVRLARYFTTQSGVLAAIASGATTLDEAERELTGRISALFQQSPDISSSGELRFTFGGYVTGLCPV